MRGIFAKNIKIKKRKRLYRKLVYEINEDKKNYDEYYLKDD